MAAQLSLWCLTHYWWLNTQKQLICIALARHILNKYPLLNNVANKSYQSAPTRLTNIKGGLRLMKPYKVKPHVNFATVSLSIYSNYMYTIHPNMGICFDLWLVTNQVAIHVTQQHCQGMWILKITQYLKYPNFPKYPINKTHNHMASAVSAHPPASSRLTEFQDGFLPQTQHQVAKPLVILIKAQQKYI